MYSSDIASKTQSASKAQASEQGTSKADTRDPKRRSTEEATSEAKKKRRSRDKELELKEVGAVPLKEIGCTSCVQF